MSGLDRYRAKRDFARTPEPAGLRFVVQEHRARRLHWDLRLEHDGALESWAIPNGIPEDPSENRLAVHVEDHPLEYLDFEGEIPGGSYGAGAVTIWDRGTYEVEKRAEGKRTVIFHGERLRGRYALFRTRGKDWLIHRMDPPRHEREAMPQHVRPMLAKPGALPRGDGWALEVKWDGVRALLYWRPGRLRIESRNLNDITRRYPELAALGRELGSREVALDGEIVALDERGRPSFELLQRRMHAEGSRRPSVAVVYMIFDLLHLDGRVTMGLPYAERRELLDGLALEGPAWRVPPSFGGDPREVLAATAEQRLEGVVAKRRTAPYLPGDRGGAWVKIKNFAREELVVAGWLPGKGGRASTFGALLLGYREDDGRLRYAGRVGTGFGERELGRLGGELALRETPHSPFSGAAQPPREARFVRPELVVEVEFTGWTREGMLRHPVYKGERAAEREVRFSNREKVLYPAAGLTKGEVIDYYEAVAPAILPHLAGRPLTFVRYPDGVDGKHFFQKRAPAHRPEWVHTAAVQHGRREIEFCVIDDVPSLLWAANLAALELHPSLSLASAPEAPTVLAFDLDPGAPAGLRECCRVALAVRDLFGALGLHSVVKTSGSKGLQVYVPLNGSATYEETKPFARAVARVLEREHPELVVSRMTKSLREGRVLIDWSQNDRAKTTVCVYSLRARERPAISTPLRWEEVEAALRRRRRGEVELSCEPRELLARVARDGDLFGAALTLKQELPAFAG